MENFEKPYGAIHNGQVMIDRLEQWYKFESEGLNLIDCAEWHYLRQCFSHIVKYIEEVESK